MKKTTKLTLMSILTIALCVSLIVGATFALFIDQKETDITITSGNVSIDASVEFTEAWSAMWVDTDYDKDRKDISDDGSATFTAGGTATYANGELVLDRIVSGDGVKLTINLTNKSNVLIKYRVQIAVEDGGLMDGLTVSYLMGGKELELEEAKTYMYSQWIETTDKAAEGGTSLGSLDVTIELPMDGSSAYQDKSCSLSIAVYAIQINGHIADENKYNAEEIVLNSDLLTAVSNLGLGSKSLVFGSWSTYAQEIGGKFGAGKVVVAGNENVRAFEHDGKIYVLSYGKLVADTDYNDQDGLFCQYDFEEVELSDVDFSTLTANTLGYMFEASNLKVVNFSGADLSKLTSISYLFAFCSQLEEVYFNGAILKNLPASDESAMSYVFHGCTSLKKVDFSEADLTNVGKISSMFWSGYRTSTSVNVGGNGGSFSSSGTPTYACANLEYVSFADATFENVTAILYDIFKGAENLKYVNFANCDLHNLTSISWFGGQTTAKRYTPALETVIFTGANLSGVQNLQYWFRYCANLETVDFRNADIRNATRMDYAFANCTNLNTVDFSGANLELVTNIDRLFSSSPNIVKANFAGALKKITTMTEVFSSAKLLQEVNFSGCDFSVSGSVAVNKHILTTFGQNDTPALVSVDFSNCDFSGMNTGWLRERFYRITTLETVNFSGAKFPDQTTAQSMFYGCTSLTTVYLWEDFDIITNAEKMFNGCTSLTDIFVDRDMDLSASITTSSNMFTDCTALFNKFGSLGTNAIGAKTVGGYFQVKPVSKQD